MKFHVGDKTYELGSGHEVRELHVLFRKDRSVRAVELTTETKSVHILNGARGVLVAGSDGTRELPVGVYDVTGKEAPCSTPSSTPSM